MKELKLLLKKFGPEELARNLNIAPSTLYFWKAGTTKPSKMAREKIIRYFKEVNNQGSRLRVV